MILRRYCNFRFLSGKSALLYTFPITSKLFKRCSADMSGHIEVLAAEGWASRLSDPPYLQSNIHEGWDFGSMMDIRNMVFRCQLSAVSK